MVATANAPELPLSPRNLFGPPDTMDHQSLDKSAIDPAKLEEKVGQRHKDDLLRHGDVRTADGSSLHDGEDILALQDLDPALNMKMHLVNNVSALQVMRSCSSRPRFMEAFTSCGRLWLFCLQC